MIDLFTDAEVKHAQAIMRNGGIVHQKLYDDVVTDEVMQRINEQTGEENNRQYMAYQLEYITTTHQNQSTQ